MKKPFTMKNTLAASALVITVAGAGVFGVTQVNAATTGDTSNPMSALVQKIATKFNLSQSEVQAVFDQDHTERKAVREAEYEKQLTQYVTEGKITLAQKDLILAKHKEMESNHQTEMESMKAMTNEERKTAMEKKRTELGAWSKTNNIDLEYVMPFGKGGHGHGGRGATAPSSTTTTQ